MKLLPALDPRQIRSLLDLGADPGLVQELIGLLEADAPPRLDSLARALAEGDAQGMVAEAHRLKGSAGNLGLSRLADLADRIEAGGRAGRLEETGPLVADLPGAYREGLEALKAAFPA